MIRASDQEEKERQSATSRRAPLNSAVRAYLAGYQRLHAIFTRRTGCASIAADIVQETYLRLRSAESVPIANPTAYVGRVATNVAIDFERWMGRSLARSATMQDDMISERPSAERELIARERLHAVLAAADRLSPRCREVFILRKIEGLEQQEIARHLGISMNMVQKHLRKALADIASVLADEE